MSTVAFVSATRSNELPHLDHGRAVAQQFRVRRLTVVTVHTVAVRTSLLVHDCPPSSSVHPTVPEQANATIGRRFLEKRKLGGTEATQFLFLTKQRRFPPAMNHV